MVCTLILLWLRLCMAMLVQCTYMYGIKPFMILTLYISRLFAMFTEIYIQNPEFGLMSDCFFYFYWDLLQQSAFLFSCFDALKEPSVLH